MSTEDWRSPSAYNYTRNLSSSGLAWEFLRRDSDYRAGHARARSQARDEDGLAASVRRWGLRFRRRPRNPSD
ncbi:transcriptional regulator domain-containing protein [Methylosinus sporium]